jgi:Phage integrase, N-terminal SAM-like domain
MGGDLARRRFQRGQIIFSDKRNAWLGRYREDLINSDGQVIRKRPQVVLGTKKELPTQRLAERKLDEILARINCATYEPTRTATVSEFAKRYREEVLARKKPSTISSANSHFDCHIIPQLGNLRLDQWGPENQQIFVNQLAGASAGGKTVKNILSTLSVMLTTAANWSYAARRVELKKLVLPRRNERVVPPHFTHEQVELLGEMHRVQQKAWQLLAKTETDGDHRASIVALREVCECLKSLGKMLSRGSRKYYHLNLRWNFYLQHSLYWLRSMRFFLGTGAWT